MPVKFLILGDSHTQVFSYANHFQDEIEFEVVTVMGASAQGAINPNNKSDSVRIFSDKLKEIKKSGFVYDYVGVMLGEVDCGFIIWHLFEQHQIPVDYQLNNSVKALFSFSESGVEDSFPKEKIFLFGANPPALGDNEEAEVPFRGSLAATQIEKTALTMKYNSMVKKGCIDRGYNYVDIVDQIMNQDTDVVDPFYKWPAPDNHHLDNQKTWKIWFNKIAKIIGKDPILD